MEFISVNHSLNQTFYVEKEAILMTIKKSIKNLKIFKCNNIDVEIFEKKNNVSIYLEIVFPKGETYSSGIKKIKNEIESNIANLIDNTPKNIEIKVIK